MPTNRNLSQIPGIPSTDELQIPGANTTQRRGSTFRQRALGTVAGLAIGGGAITAAEALRNPDQPATYQDTGTLRGPAPSGDALTVREPGPDAQSNPDYVPGSATEATRPGEPGHDAPTNPDYVPGSASEATNAGVSNPMLTNASGQTSK